MNDSKKAEDLAEALQDQNPYKHWEHDGDLAYIPGYIVWCATAWEPPARLLGNARAGDIASAVSALIRERDRMRALLKESRDYVDYARRNRFLCVPEKAKPQDVRDSAQSLLADIDEVLK